MIKIEYLASGWEDKQFQNKLQDAINARKIKGFYYYDIKISSKGNHCMVIYKDKNNYEG